MKRGHFRFNLSFVFLNKEIVSLFGHRLQIVGKVRIHAEITQKMDDPREKVVLAVKELYQLDFTELKQEQKEIIWSLLEKKDVFGLLPTGFGKSMIFTLFPLILDQVHKNIIDLFSELTCPVLKHTNLNDKNSGDAVLLKLRARS